MKHIIFIIAFLVCGLIMPTTSSAHNKGEVVTVVYSVGLHCNNCKKKVENNIAFEKGVKDLKVNLEEKTVTVTYRTDKTDSEKIKEAIEKLGYTVLIKEEKKGDSRE
ncbi:MAG: heavy-metal-associated domain-containing protein [Marinilabiliaceae bacterium]